MALNLLRTIGQVENLSENISAQIHIRSNKIQSSLYALKSIETDDYEKSRKAETTKVKWNLPVFPQAPSSTYPLPELPRNYCVLGVDGSHIDINRHMPADCFLINIGGIGLLYGDTPDAWLFNEPTLYADDSDLFIRNPENEHQGELVSGSVLDAKRACEELSGLVSMLQTAPDDVPVVGLLDGSFVMFGISAHPAFVRQSILTDDYLASMESIRVIAQNREVAIASYISLPGSMDVMNGIRLAVCPYRLTDVTNCDRKCGHSRLNTRPCDLTAGGLRDRDIFSILLKDGERSAIFQSSTNIVKDYYGPDHAVCFFYVRAGAEIGRVEIPAWVAMKDSLVNLVHTTIIAQTNGGPGYPVCLKEAHEQAVISTKDRQHFVWLVEDMLAKKNVPVYSSEKNLSKMHRHV